MAMPHVLIGSGENPSLEHVKELFCLSDPQQEKPLVYRLGSARTRGWLKLPSDITNLIADKIGFCPHLQKFGAVCKEWHEPTSEIIEPDKINSEPPMLLLPYNEQTQISTFVEMRNMKKFDLKTPELQGQQICGLSNGWVAMTDDKLDILLFNPFTRAVIKHPSNITAFDERFGEIEQSKYIWKVVLSGDPSSSKCAIAVIFSHFGRLGVSRMGERRWSVASSNPESRYHEACEFYDDVIFYRGKIFAAKSCGGAIYAFDYCGHLKIAKVIRKPWEDPSWYSLKKYLVKWCGLLLYIMRFDEKVIEKSETRNTWRFEVYSLNSNMKSWSRVHSLGEYSLFVGPNDTISISAKEFNWIKPDCIYFTQHSHDSNGYQWDNGVYSLKENIVIEKFDIEHSLSFWPASAIWYQPKF